MEKYRKYGDAATGINPFVLMRTPTTFSVVVAAVLFPLRLTGALLFLTALVVLDVVAYFFFLIPGMSCVSWCLLAPCQRELLRCLLFALGNVGITRASPRATAVANAAGGDATPVAGDVVVVNMQSVWDMCVLEVAGRLPLCVVAFYIGGAAGANSGGDANKKKTDHDSRHDTLLVMEPSPFQRWRVWWHIYHTGSLEFLRAAAGGDCGDYKSNTEPVLHLAALQQRCERIGVPIVLFAEGSCTNGKGMLRTSPLWVRTAPRRVFVCAVDYDTTAVHTVLRPHRLLSFIFLMSASLHGSRDPAWYSPPFPTATVRMVALLESSLSSDSILATKTTAGDGATVMWEEAKVRQALCAASKSRRVLVVGLHEKCGYAEACVGVKAGSVSN
ncbi:hypothetical protein C3747_128g12 [Trypanosoma cruzi]|uniref:Phospholipid/glycerol acyltransferase domain-containing protein n=2 Tax=Trypanosoma cruzi TaxID=5693 RepID=Q4DL61_TRYCC|nr:hypothetical protein, conserved [Trypanosoma cruzi]EAN93251.1 hypothetical protein, conserved [Trypanosoma cruzi]PWV05553.1 hypothetical protein C3747_128g12 [Trypanosoma cruzi]RNC46028.1 acyltransferase [Trypanosoma cruzi]|eukprot:XP_815102.1 hypothetical protein [Trypanosoma cruzi strain CL Brener]